MSKRVLPDLAMVSCLVVGLASSLAVQAADAVDRKSESRPVQGDITAVTRTDVTVKPRLGEPVTIPVSDIARVRWDDEPAVLNLGRSAEQSGALDKALESYQNAKNEYTGNNARLRADLDFLIARATAKAALADPGQLDDAIARLEAFRQTHPDSFRYYDTLNYLGQVYMAKGQTSEAQDVFDEMAKAPQRPLQMAAKVATARLKLAQQQVAAAQSLFAEVAAIETQDPNEQSQRNAALIGKATCEQQLQQYDNAIATLDDVIAEAGAHETQLQAEAYLRQGDCLREQDKTKEAVLAYLHVDVLFSNEKPLHAEALYWLSKLWGAVGHAERAADARDRLLNQYANSAWAQRLSAGN